MSTDDVHDGNLPADHGSPEVDGKSCRYLLTWYSCGHHGNAQTPRIVEVDAAVQAVVDDLIDSVRLALGDHLSNDEITAVVTTVGDAVANNWDELIAHFDRAVRR